MSVVFRQCGGAIAIFVGIERSTLRHYREYRVIRSSSSSCNQLTGHGLGMKPKAAIYGIYRVAAIWRNRFVGAGNTPAAAKHASMAGERPSSASMISTIVP